MSQSCAGVAVDPSHDELAGSCVIDVSGHVTALAPPPGHPLGWGFGRNPAASRLGAVYGVGCMDAWVDMHGRVHELAARCTRSVQVTVMLAGGTCNDIQ